jgi:ubiquinone/menaquinone biosynthesis C-methylase UbiE
MGIWGKFVYPAIKYFRAKRVRKLVSMYPNLNEMSVLDVGGRPIIWELLAKECNIRPKKLILLNTEEEEASFDQYERVIGDGRNLPYPDNTFDLVFSNSVIEHVGNETDKIAFAQECLRVGKNIYIQTPNKWFPVETHLVTLFIHWFPQEWFKKLSFLSIRFLFLLSNRQQFQDIVSGIRLVDKQQLKTFFPQRTIVTERFFGIAKSFIVT